MTNQTELRSKIIAKARQLQAAHGEIDGALILEALDSEFRATFPTFGEGTDGADWDSAIALLESAIAEARDSQQDCEPFTFKCSIMRGELGETFTIECAEGTPDSEVWKTAADACGLGIPFSEVTVFSSGEMEGRTGAASLFVGLGV